MASTPAPAAASGSAPDQTPQDLPAGRYLAITAGAIAAALGTMLAINLVADPQWYFGGSVLTGKNFVLDERASKPTRLDRLDYKPACLLFGTSSGSLMNEARDIAGTPCFNLAFSRGHADEFQHVAEWAAARGFKPDTVVLEIDAVSLMPNAPTSYMPEFVLKKQAPPPPYEAYLSFNALNFSFKTLLQMQDNPRYYNREFNASVPDDAPRYDPTKEHAFSGSLGPFEAKGLIAAIDTFRAKWPQARVICYSAPFIPDFTAEIIAKGTLDTFTRSLWEIARHCDSFRDFNIPNALINDYSLTYDGIHYRPEVNIRFAKVFAGSGEFPESDISGLTPEQYSQRYRDAMARLTRQAAARAPARP